ncbi:MAG TPA: response regulator [Burkholderiales bacterium]|nr:response regulator [Burkholderiales bacterium]
MRSVLVADDNRDSADSLALLLRARGHVVHVAYDGRSALEVARQSRPDVALLDVILPSMDGYELGRQLRKEFGSALRMLAVSGFSSDEDRRRAQEAGFDQYIVKPVDPLFLGSLLQ